MKHTIQQDDLDPLGLPIVDAIQKCVHCGFCLPTCPTYQIEQQEMDSPRGRILLMKEVLEGNLAADDVSEHIDRCLGCLACETACPSGVPYGHLHSSYKSLTEKETSKPLGNRIRNGLVHQTTPFPTRFRIATKLGRLASPFQFLMPRFLRPMLALIPGKLPKRYKLPIESPATGRRIGRVGLLAGCAQQVLKPEINRATIRLLNHIGYDVFTPKLQGCCGALDWHEGRLASARKMAEKNFRLFPDDLDAIITNAAGCGSAIREYELVFSGTVHQESALSFSSRVVDISLFLTSQKLPDFRFENPTRIAYHDACHLAHAQGIRSEPRQLLSSIKNVELVPMADSERCCGSAGSYNIRQPDIAEQLGVDKARSIADTDCDIVVTGNIGCLIQVEKHLEAQFPEKRIEVLHTIQVLDRAIQQDKDISSH